MKTCGHCGKPLESSKFYTDKRAKNGLRSWCIICCSKSSKKYNAAFAEERYVRRKKYKATFYANPKNYEAKLAHERDRYRNQSSEKREQLRQYSRKWRLLNARKIRDRKLREAFGISLEQYETLETKQRGRCAICKNLPGKKSLAVDHCHRTKRIRKLLCGACNTTLGLMKENISHLKRMINYIRQHATPNSP